MFRSVALISLALGLSLSAALADEDSDRAPSLRFQIVPLVSDQQGAAATQDPVLVNPWGIASVPGGPFWISDNQNGVATIYDGKGMKFGGSFTVPPPKSAMSGTVSAPTGVIWNPTSQFQVPGTTLPSLFIFATEDGTISGWAPNLPTAPQSAVLAVDNSASGAVYKGLAYGNNAQGNFIYAANFNAGTVDVFDGTFAPAKLGGAFADPQIPSNFAPFNIRNIDGNLFVAYAEQNQVKHDDVAGQGNGFVNVFNTDGVLLRRFAQHGSLNSPWGITPVPFGFDPENRLAGAILIGNFGDGAIHAYSIHGHRIGQLAGADGKPLTLPGLWSLQFGEARAASPQTLYFTAGPGEEHHGVFGGLSPVSQ